MSSLNHSLARIRLMRGFTLIEVMLAMAVFSIAGVAILGVAETNGRNLAYLETKTLASWQASNQLVEMRLAQQWPPKNNRNGKAALAGHDWYWQQKVVATTDNNMRAVVIEVRLDKKEEKALASLLTYVSNHKG